MFETTNSNLWAPGDQLDAVRSLVFQPLNLAQLVCADRGQGRLRWHSSIVRTQQASFGVFNIDDFHTHRPPRHSPILDDAYILVWLRAGAMVQEGVKGEQRLVSKGQLYLYDTAQPYGFQWHDVHATYLVLPRDIVTTSLGGRLPPSGVLSAGRRSLAPFLQAQLDLLERQGPLLEADPLNSAIDVSVQLGMALVRESHHWQAHAGQGNAAREDVHHAGQDGASVSLLATARLYMRRHFSDSALDVARIAAAVHCSRARLYRCFAAQGSSIYGELRDLRLQVASHCLLHSADSIALIAWRCGFTSASSFSRMFRAHFDASPKVWRTQAHR